jgi:hypothetical protein
VEKYLLLEGCFELQFLNVLKDGNIFVNKKGFLVFSFFLFSLVFLFCVFCWGLELGAGGEAEKISADKRLLVQEEGALPRVAALVLGPGDLEKTLHLVGGRPIGQEPEDESPLGHREAAHLPRISSAVHRLVLDVGGEVGAKEESDALREVRVAEDLFDLGRKERGLGRLLEDVVADALQDPLRHADLRLPAVVQDGLLLLPLQLLLGNQLVAGHVRPPPLKLVQALVPPHRVPGDQRNLQLRVGALLEGGENGVLAGRQLGCEIILQQVGVGLEELGLLGPPERLVKGEEFAVRETSLAQHRSPVEAADEPRILPRDRIRERVHLDESVRGGLLERKGTVYGSEYGSSIFIG